MKLTKLALMGTLACSITGLTACNNMMPASSVDTDADMVSSMQDQDMDDRAIAARAASNTAMADEVVVVDDDYADDQAMTTMNLVQVAQSNPDFSLLVEAVQAAGLVDMLADPNATYTVFAPTNEAFVSALESSNMTKEELFANKALLTKILGYHVVNANMPIYAENVKPGTIKTASKDTFTVTAQGQLLDEMGRRANIVQTDIGASNGVIHVINRVMMPQ